ncbi:AAA family ATPase [Weissella cibaria]|uniref:AAA family ATPase n=1 Tax=Weissella cibaria TaxID=137591 RepID=UPI000BFF988E|nr:AAA family ATPase [Weissella cibaria]
MKKIQVFNGSDNWFSEQIEGMNTEYVDFKLISTKINEVEVLFNMVEKLEGEMFIIFGESFRLLSESGLTLIPIIIELLPDSFTDILIHNPPKDLRRLLSVSNRLSSVREYFDDYRNIPLENIPIIKENYSKEIKGQDDALVSLLASVYKTGEFEESKVKVVLLYGPPGVGKTESVKLLARYGGVKLTRIQMSMMQTMDGADFIFGTDHSKVGLTQSLLLRDSNLILFDEFDKVNKYFYNAFYQMFDEALFEDKNYQVNLAGATIFLTTNFSSRRQIIENIGEPLFSRLFDIVEYKNLSVNDLEQLIDVSIDEEIKNISKEDRVFIDIDSVKNVFKGKDLQFLSPRLLKNNIRSTLTKIIISKKFLN